MRAIIKRELYSYFCSPLAYVVISIYLFFSGLFFTVICLSSGSSDLSYVFSNMQLITVFLTPIICMRLISEETRQKTDQALLTAPVSVTRIVLGKFFAACILYLTCMAIYLVYGFTLSFFTTPDWSVIISNFLGLLLFASALMAIDVFLSSLTESQTIAAITGFAAGLVIYLLDNISNSTSIVFVKKILNAMSFSSHYQTFPVGLLDPSDIVFFLSVAALFIFLTIRVIEKKRWS